MRTISMNLVLIASMAIASTSVSAAIRGAALSPLTKVSLPDARRAASAARPGIIKDQELEKEKGGSGLRYSFDILSHGEIYEVGIDASTVAVLQNGVDRTAD